MLVFASESEKMLPVSEHKDKDRRRKRKSKANLSLSRKFIILGVLKVFTFTRGTI